MDVFISMINCLSPSLSDPYASVYVRLVLCWGATLAFATYYSIGVWNELFVSAMVFGRCCHCCCFWFNIYFITMLVVCAVHTHTHAVCIASSCFIGMSLFLSDSFFTLPLCKQSAFRNAILHNFVVWVFCIFIRGSLDGYICPPPFSISLHYTHNLELKLLL